MTLKIPTSVEKTPEAQVPKTLIELTTYLDTQKSSLTSDQIAEFTTAIKKQETAQSSELTSYSGTDEIIIERITGTNAFIKRTQESIDARVKISKDQKRTADTKATAPASPEVASIEKAKTVAKQDATKDIIDTARTAQKWETYRVASENTTVPQAQGFVKYLEQIPALKDSNYLKQLKGEIYIDGDHAAHAEASNSTGGAKIAIYDPAVKANLPSLISHAVKGTPYVNFHAGFAGYQENFVRITKEAYKNPDIKKALDALYIVTQSGATAEIATRAINQTKEIGNSQASISKYLGSLTAGEDSIGDRKGALFNLTGRNIQASLSGMKETDFLSIIQKSLLVSGNTTKISSIAELTTGLTSDSTLAFSILGGLNTMDRRGGMTTFDTTTAANEAKTLIAIGEKLKASLDVARNTLPANLTPEQKKAALAALDIMKKEAELPGVQKSFGLFITNQGAAGGVGLSKMITPSTAFNTGISVAGGKLGIEFGIRSEVSNTLTGTTNIGLGASVLPVFLPFAEIGGSDHQNSANLRLFPMGGFAVTLAHQISNAGKVTRQAEETLRNSENLSLQLNQFRMNGVLADMIKFSPDLSALGSADRPPVQALVDETNIRTQNLLKARKFDTITNEVVRYALLEQAIRDATAETTLQINRNSVSAGDRWKSIGVSFGKIWVFPFIIPFVSRGGEDLIVTRTVGGKTPGEKKSETKKLAEYLLPMGIVDTKDATGNITSRTYHFDPKKFIVSGDTTRDGGTVQNGSTPHWMIFNPTKNTIELTGQPKTLNFETNASGKTILIIGERTKFGKQEITTGTKPMGSAVLLDTSMTRGELAEKLKRNAELRSNIFNLARTKHPEIVTMFELLANNNIDWLKTHLASMKQYKTIGKQLLDLGLADNTIATFKYGSQASNNKPASFYTNENVATMRKGSLKAERDLAVKNGISAMNGNGHSDVAFVLGKNEKNHTPTMSGSWYPGQSMTVSVFSTPTNGVGTIDKYDGSVQLIGKKIDITDATYRTQIIDDTSRSKTALTTPLKALNDFLTSQKITKVVEMSAYCDMLKTGDASKLGIPGLTFTAGKLPAVFESRAMIRDQGGNICINRSHGVVYPLFTIGTTSQTDAPPLADIAVTATSISEGIITPGSSQVSVVGAGAFVVGAGHIGSAPNPTANPPGNPPNGPGTTTAPNVTPGTPGAGAVNQPIPAAPAPGSIPGLGSIPTTGPAVVVANIAPTATTSSVIQSGVSSQAITGAAGSIISGPLKP